MKAVSYNNLLKYFHSLYGIFENKIYFVMVFKHKNTWSWNDNKANKGNEKHGRLDLFTIEYKSIYCKHRLFLNES